ncbi:MAG TPA: hypothetical protein VM074_01225 [Solimonas sp.]|nr:hypothetical protein [Solimonas sp.]
MALHQINLTFDPNQDRLQLRISTTEQTEYRFWLTRRLVKRLWPGLVQLTQSTPPVRQQLAPESRHAMLEFQREQALAEARFGEPYPSGTLTPVLPGEPMLIANVRLRTEPHGAHVVVLQPREGEAVTLRLETPLLHALMKLLQDAVAKLEWDLALEWPAVVAERRLN